MIYFIAKTLLSALLIAAISEIAKRSPAFAALIASLPLVSVLGMVWLWRDTEDSARMIKHAEATFWFVIPSLPMFLVIPALMRTGVNFYLALFLGIALTAALYLCMTFVLARLGIEL